MNLISEDYLMHHGVKGQKWGVRHEKRNKRIIDREIRYQQRKISDYEKRAAAYEKSAKDVRMSGAAALQAQGYSKKDSQKAVNLVASKRETEAKWNRHLAKHYKDYNKRLSQINVSQMSKKQVWQTINDLGNVKVKEINNSWKEPASTKEYYKAKGYNVNVQRGVSRG